MGPTDEERLCGVQNYEAQNLNIAKPSGGTTQRCCFRIFRIFRIPEFSTLGNFWPLTFWTNKVKVQHSEPKTVVRVGLEDPCEASGPGHLPKTCGGGHLPAAYRCRKCVADDSLWHMLKASNMWQSSRLAALLISLINHVLLRRSPIQVSWKNMKDMKANDRYDSVCVQVVYKMF